MLKKFNYRSGPKKGEKARARELESARKYNCKLLYRLSPTISLSFFLRLFSIPMTRGKKVQRKKKSELLRQWLFKSFSTATTKMRASALTENLRILGLQLRIIPASKPRSAGLQNDVSRSRKVCAARYSVMYCTWIAWCLSTWVIRAQRSRDLVPPWACLELSESSLPDSPIGFKFANEGVWACECVRLRMYGLNERKRLTMMHQYYSTAREAPSFLKPFLSSFYFVPFAP